MPPGIWPGFLWNLQVRPQFLFPPGVALRLYAGCEARIGLFSRQNSCGSTKHWDTVFPNASCAVALIDRLTHHVEILVVEGRSYRRREAELPQQQRKRRRPRRNDSSDGDDPPRRRQ